jgi:hypothetical protein
MGRKRSVWMGRLIGGLATFLSEAAVVVVVGVAAVILAILALAIF